MGKHISDMTLDELKDELQRLYGEESIDAEQVNEVKKLIAQKEMTIEQMKEKRREIQEQMKQHSWANPDHAEVLNGLQQEEADINEQIRQAQETEQVEAREQRVEEGKTQISTAIDELGIEDPNVKKLIIIVAEDNIRALQSEHAQVLEGLNKDHHAEVAGLKQTIKEQEESFANLEGEVEYFSLKNAELEKALELESKLHQQTLDGLNDSGKRLNEIDQNRKNAFVQLEEAEAEILRLRSHIEDLQQDLANAPAPKPAIDITPTKEKSELVEAINKKYKSAVPLNNAGLYFEVEDEEGNKEVMPKAEVEELQRKELVMPELGTSFRIDDASREKDTPTDETRIITVDEEAEISEGEQGSDFPNTESQGPDQVGPSNQGTYDMDTTRYATYRELQTVKDEMYRMQRSLDDQFGTTFVKAG